MEMVPAPHYVHYVVGEPLYANATSDLWLSWDWAHAGHQELCL